MLKQRFIFAVLVTVFLCSNAVLSEVTYCQKSGSLESEGEKTRCDHGRCNSQSGQCECLHCWSGSDCSVQANQNLPSFINKNIEVEIDVDDHDPYWENVAIVGATDKDSSLCEDNQEDCPCSVIYYLLLGGNEESKFVIHPDSGVVKFTPGRDLDVAGSPYTLTILALNEGDAEMNHVNKRDASEEERAEFSDIATVVVHTLSAKKSGKSLERKERSIETALEVYEEPLSRSKRDTIIPSEMLFKLEIDGVNSNTEDTSMDVGDMKRFILTLWVPNDKLYAISVELNSPIEGDMAVMTLHNVEVLMGDNFWNQNTGSEYEITLESDNSDMHNHRAVINLQTNYNDGSDSSDEESNKITITFDVIMSNNPEAADATKYWISAAVEYKEYIQDNNGNYWDEAAWVGHQPIYTDFTIMDSQEFTDPIFEITELFASDSASAFYFRAHIEMTNPSQNLKLNFFTPFNTSTDVSIYDVYILKRDRVFDSYPLPKLSESLSSDISKINYATFDLGEVNIKGFDPDGNYGERADIWAECVVNLDDYTSLEAEKLWIGAILQVNIDKVFSAQLPVTKLDFEDLTTHPDIQFYPLDGNVLLIGGAAGLYLDICTSFGETTDFIVDFSVPYDNDQSMMMFRHSEIVSIGSNMPKYTWTSPVIMSEDYVKYELGHFTNLGLDASSTAANMIRIYVAVRMSNKHTSVSAGSTTDLTAGVRYKTASEAYAWVGHLTLEETDTMPKTYTTDDLPEFEINNRARDLNIYNKSAASFDLDIMIPPLTTYSPITINIRTPIVEHKTFLSICQFNVKSVGEYLWCYDTEDIITSTNSSEDTEGDSWRDLGTIELGPMTNPWYDQVSYDREKAILTLEVHVILEEHVEMVDDLVLWVHFDIDYGQNQKWIGQSKLDVQFEKPSLYSDESVATYEITSDEESSTYLKPGAAAVFNLAIDIEKQTVTTYGLNMTMPNASLSVCRLKLIHHGHNIPCFNLNQLADYRADDENTLRQDFANLDLGPIRNTGFFPWSLNGTDDMLIAEVVVKLMRGNKYAENSTHSFEVASLTDQTSIWSTAQSIIADIEPYTFFLPNLPEFELGKLSGDGVIYDEIKITKGAAAIFYLDIYIPFGQIADYDIEFHGDAIYPEKTTVGAANIVSSGWNVPCINDSYVKTEFKSSLGNELHLDIAEMIVGDLTNIVLPKNGENFTDSADNKVRAFAVVQVSDDDTVEDEDKLWVGGAAIVNRVVDNNEDTVINPGNMWLLQTPTYVTDEIILEEAGGEPIIELYRPNVNGTIMTIASEVTYFINVTFPRDLQTPLNMTVNMPFNNSALMVVTNLTMTHVGKNFASGDRWIFDPTYISSGGTTQNDKANYYFGPVLNHGITYISTFGSTALLDNQFHMELTFQLTDHPDNRIDGSVIDFDITFDYSLGRQIVVGDNVTVKIIGDERPLLNFDINVDPTSVESTKQGDIIEGRGIFYHHADSTGHATDVSINLMLPSYIEFVSVGNYTGINYTISAGEYGIKIKFAIFYFADVFWFAFNVTLDPYRKVPQGLAVNNHTVPADLSYFEQNILEEDQIRMDYTSSIEILTYSFQIEECYDPIEIPLKCQYSSSSVYNKDYKAYEAEFDAGFGWAPSDRGYSPYKGYDYLQVNLRDVYRVSQIDIQVGVNDTEHCLTSFIIQYSQEGLAWIDYIENDATMVFENEFIFGGFNDTADPYFSHVLANPFEAPYLRIVPKTFEGAYPLMRFRIFGCIKVEYADQESCFVPFTDINPPTGIIPFERSWLLSKTFNLVFVCVLQFVNGPNRCSLFVDESWTVLDSNLHSVIAISTSRGQVYGLAQNQNALLRSDDFGQSWRTVTQVDYKDALSEDIVFGIETEFAEEIPFRELLSEPIEWIPIESFNNVSTTNSSYELLPIRSDWALSSEGLHRRVYKVPDPTTVPPTTAKITSVPPPTTDPTTQAGPTFTEKEEITGLNYTEAATTVTQTTIRTTISTTIMPTTLTLRRTTEGITTPEGIDWEFVSEDKVAVWEDCQEQE